MEHTKKNFMKTEDKPLATAATGNANNGAHSDFNKLTGQLSGREEKEPLKAGMRVYVSAELTGDGTRAKAVITEIRKFAGALFYELSFLDRPGGMCVTNGGLLTPVEAPQK